MTVVSVGLPVYNGENYLAEAVQSILGQDHADLELLLADNASTDATQEICRHFVAQDERVSYHRSDVNRGATWNYNRLPGLARGEYFKWAAHDDVCEPAFLSACVACLQQDDQAVLAYPRTMLIDGDGAVLDAGFEDGLDIRGSSPAHRLRRYTDHVGEQHAVFGVVRLADLRRTTLIGNHWGGDISLLAQLVLLGEFHEVPERLFRRRYHPSTSMVADPDPRAVAAWFDTTKSGRMPLPRTRLLVEILAAVVRAPLTPGEKIPCTVGAASTWRRRHGRVMAGEVKRALLQELRRTEVAAA